MKITQISVFLDNRAGRLAEMTQILENNHINIRALYVADTTDYGILRMIVDDPEKTRQVLRENGFTAKATEVLEVRMEDVPGGLHEIVETISAKDIAIEYLYAFTGKDNKDKASVVMKVSDNDTVAELLKDLAK
jgi:hypothetical protein